MRPHKCINALVCNKINQNHIVHMWFYKPLDEYNPWNRAVALFDPPFCHCELQLEDNRALTIYNSTPVRLIARSFDRVRYTCLQIPCTTQQHTALQQACEKIANAGLSFDRTVLWRHAFGISSEAPPGKTFCSKLNADVLKAAGILAPTTNTNHITPSSLYRMLQSRDATMRLEIDTPAATQPILTATAIDWAT